MKEERFFYDPKLAGQKVSPLRGDLEGSEAHHALKV